MSKFSTKSAIILILIAVVTLNLSSVDNNNGNIKTKAEYYKNRYKVKLLNEKITDNQGNGYDSLYGTRNMRTILFGVAYRGGANNFYHKTNKRNNSNPLPIDGLQHLANEGFSAAIYLYGTNFSSAPKLVISDNKKDTLRYYQNSLSDRKQIKRVLLMVKEVIDNPQKGPIYLHCWNGWHQSGYISAMILMQFCGYTNQQAVEYWIANTDGNSKGYDKIKNLILEFEPFDDIKVDRELMKSICPCGK
jgi:hypothetical protein